MIVDWGGRVGDVCGGDGESVGVEDESGDVCGMDENSVSAKVWVEILWVFRVGNFWCALNVEIGGFWYGGELGV